MKLNATYTGFMMNNKRIFRLFLTVSIVFTYLIPTAQASWGQNWGTMIWGQSTPSYQVPFMDGMGLIISALVIAVIGLVSMRFGSKRMAAFLVVVLAPITAITVPSLVTFTNGTVADATQVNANFQAINDYLSTNVPANSVIYSLPDGVDTLDMNQDEIEAICNDDDGCIVDLCLTRLHQFDYEQTSYNWEITDCNRGGRGQSVHAVGISENGAFIGLIFATGAEAPPSIRIDKALYTDQCNYTHASTVSGGRINFRVTGSGVVIADCAFTHTPGVSTTFTNSPNPNGWTIIKNLDDCHENDSFPSGCAPQNIAVEVIFTD